MERFVQSGPGRSNDSFNLLRRGAFAPVRPAVKLSDNPLKAMGPPADIARYRRVFQVGTQAPLPVAV